FGVREAQTNKRLTYSYDGETNNTVVKVNGETIEFGGSAGNWLHQDAPLPPDPKQQKVRGTRSVWAIGQPNNGLHFTQTLAIVPRKQPVLIGGESKRLLDTVLVRYTIENKDSRPHRAGLRIQVDTLIGSNDGVPFTVPGLPGLVNAFHDFQGPRVPDFLQALE